MTAAMQVEGSIFCTAEVAAAESISFWAGALGHICGGLRADGYGAKTLDGEIRLATIGSLKLCDIAATRHRIMLANNFAETANASKIKIVYQLEGRSHYKQDGTEYKVAPGDCIIYDVSRPHTIINTGANRHLVVAMSKDMARLNDIGFRETPVFHEAHQNGIGRVTANFIQSVANEVCVTALGSDDDLSDVLLRLLHMSLARAGEHQPNQLIRAGLKHEIKRLVRLNLTRLANLLGYSKRFLHLVHR